MREGIIFFPFHVKIFSAGLGIEQLTFHSQATSQTVLFNPLNESVPYFTTKREKKNSQNVMKGNILHLFSYHRKILYTVHLPH